MLMLLFVSAYLLGNILTGSIIGQYFYKEKIRAVGSGNPGARNVGRLYGKFAFIATFLGDAAKGMLVVGSARMIGLASHIELFLLLAVIIGHIFPLIHKFQGGKGISTFIGGILLFNPLAFILFISVFGVLYLFLKSFTIAGLGALLFYPLYLFLLSYEGSVIVVTSLIVGLILYAHRENIREKSLRKKERLR